MNLIKLLLAVSFLNTVAFAGAGLNNHIAIFGGATIIEKEAHPSIGLDYEYFVNPYFGVTAVSEVVFGDHTEFINGAGLAYHPISSLKLAFIPALITIEGNNDLLLRSQIEYAFHIGDYSISPAAMLDYTHGHAIYVFGAAFGYGF
jgi:hypothetical protein